MHILIASHPAHSLCFTALSRLSISPFRSNIIRDNSVSVFFPSDGIDMLDWPRNKEPTLFLLRLHFLLFFLLIFFFLSRSSVYC